MARSSFFAGTVEMENVLNSFHDVDASHAKAKHKKTQRAALMKTRRASINRLLDPENAAVNLQAMEKAARAVGNRLEIQLA